LDLRLGYLYLYLYFGAEYLIISGVDSLLVLDSLQKKAEDRPSYPELLQHRFVSHLSTTSVDISTFVCEILDTPSSTDAAVPRT